MVFERRSLKTDRLLIRPWQVTDVDAAISYGSDPEWGRYLWNTPQPYTRLHAEQFVTASATEDWIDHAQWALTFHGEVIGGIRLYITDMPGRVAGMGYNLAPSHWGRGLATEAALAVLRYAFEECGLQRVHATADSRNHASIRVLQKVGMKHEGTLRRHRMHHGEYVDEVNYGMLTEEWHSPE